MSTFAHPITLHAASRDETEVVDVLVDTGATFTAIPSLVLERLCIVRHRLVRLRLADGRLKERALAA